MVLYNWSTKELTAKIVYYGPGLGGKSTNLQWIHDKAPIKNKGKMLSLNTEADRTLFFDFLPIELGQIRGNRTRIQLYTVPGQVFYNATRRMVLKGADAVVFVCDSQEQMLDANLESLDNMRQNLQANEIDPDEIPVVFQYNKRDLPNALPIEILNERLNTNNGPFFEAIATTGVGVEDTLKAVTMQVFRSLAEKYGDGAAVSASPISTAPGNASPGIMSPPRTFAQAPPPPPSAAASPLNTPRPPQPARPASASSTLPPVSPFQSGESMLDSLELEEEPLDVDDIEVEVLPSEESSLRSMPSQRVDPQTTLASTTDEASAIREFLRAPQSIPALDKTPIPKSPTPPPAAIPQAPAEISMITEEDADLTASGSVLSAPVSVEILDRAGEHEVVIPVEVVLPKGTVQISLHLRLNLLLRTTK